MAGQTEADVKARLDEVRDKYGDGGKVVDEICVVAIRLARDIDEIRAELEEHRH